MHKVVVFGGSGFLGSHVADALTQAGHRVTVFDIKASAYLQPSQKMVVGDILDRALVAKVVGQADMVYHFAGIADIQQASEHPLESVERNILGTTIILEACRKAKVRRFVFASSLYVYSKAGSFYRSTKQACELLIENYREVYKLPYTILRYGSLYGPRADAGNFVRKTLVQALEKGRIVREGDGEEVREYIHVLDAARLSVDILHADFIDQYAIISGDQPIKVKDLLSMIREMLGNKVSVKYVAPVDSSHYEVTPYTFSPRLAKKINPRTHVDLGQGILKYLEEIHCQLRADSGPKVKVRAKRSKKESA